MTFLTKIRQIFSKNNTNQCLAIAFQQQSVSLCSFPRQKSEGVSGDENSAKVIFQQEKASSADYSPAIKALHKNCDIEGEVCLVLSDAQSQIVQVDKPNIPEDEINSALKWQVKDLVTISPANMVLDYYDAPTLAGGKERINVVCAPLDELKKILAATEQKNKVKVNAITTQEFAFANLLPPQSDAILLVCQQPNEEVVLLIVKKQQIFFHRRLPGFSKVANKTADELSSSMIDGLSLEIQRSTDYFERQLKQAPIKEIKVLIPMELENIFIDKLAENSAVPVSLLELPRPYHQHRDFGAVIGASLESVPYNAETDALAGASYDS